MAAIIYNVTTKVANFIYKDWLVWMKEIYIPEMIATGCFVNAVILKLRGVDDSEGPTFAVQYHAANEDDYEKYLEHFATHLRTAALQKWGDKIVSFRTVLEVVN